ncbi:hypothetical protein [Eubacterium limosum]|uniref:hypothetical protein n=1 Tax=Eubacterium limosum TaxID=1736 RepID=UPI0010632ED1|nr:hypothetical protein [Eubacterium limosum]
MKKKASLLISGITTVAMLAVAVGSFAAWDTLTASPNQLSATSSTPAVLEVTATPFGNDKLIPEYSDSTGGKKSIVGTGDVIKLVSTVSPTLTDSKLKNVKLKFAEPEVTVAEGAKITKDQYVVTVYGKDYAEATPGTAITAGTETAFEKGDTYTIVLKLKDGTTAADVPAAGENVKVDIEFTAVQ